ncbi:ABC transporter ATP-binding protein [Rathayibacter sp. AY1B1]|uniref:ABC transporter ATP-binding protein n=1 Tax=unclassified Rathayibacter TaxID=2609250 RepID=UPI000CE8876F|nr:MULTISPECIES: ABC transporter ATP-binding protein [unclassified Rathayibacter]PPI19150.1 ABC transporter ATP-binding protein [Rathayibacter sp. AY1B6]PPI31324.1 ABC transporter ATP-binding protein [Rathayibacter sp. AY1B1]
MSAVIEVNDLTKHYGRMRAVDGIGFALEENRIHGLLGRNGAGKTTLMTMLTGQEFASSGEIRVFGRSPVENAAVLSRTCFIKESQKYPDDFRVKHVLRSAPWFFDGWDEAFARELVEDFRLPVDRKIKKLSRGQLSAIGVVVGLASRAPLTFFDEPYLGLDAVARQLFYDRLLQDFAEHPRTVVLSTHLIDEVSSLLEHVLVMDEGRLVVDSDAEELRGAAATVIGPRQAVEAFTAGREVIARSALGSRASATLPRLDDAGRAFAARHGLELESVPLQQLVVQLTTGKASE